MPPGFSVHFALSSTYKRHFRSQKIELLKRGVPGFICGQVRPRFGLTISKVCGFSSVFGIRLCALLLFAGFRLSDSYIWL